MQRKLTNEIVPDLVSLYRENSVAKRLFDWFASRQNDARETPVDRAAHMAAASYSDTLKVFRTLEDLAVGRLIEGRLGRKTRFAWTYSVKSIGAAAREEGSSLEAIDSDATENVQTDDDAETGKILHRLQLRPNYELVIEAPDDLTMKEAERIAIWVRSLPFGD